MMEPVEIHTPESTCVDKPWAVTGTKMQRRHNIINSLSLDPNELEQMNFDRYDRYRAICENETMVEKYRMEDAQICVVAFGIAARIAKNAITEARAQGVKVGLIRPITLWPFPEKELAAAAKKCSSFLSVELNMGQMIDDIRLAISCSRPVELCNRAGGIIPSPEEVYRKIMEMSRNGGAQA